MDKNSPVSLKRAISPPVVIARKKRSTSTTVEKSLENQGRPDSESNISSLAAIEAGKTTVSDHLSYFSHHLSAVVRSPPDASSPRLSISDYASLYRRNLHPRGHHFVMHQHNHPVAGCHYDLRLQFSESSTVSFAIPYGLPGNPNSRHQGRLAIETRVHTLWNNLIESASHETGSLIIWDTGEYEVLPRRMTVKNGMETDDDDDGVEQARLRENGKLIAAFQTRYIRLQLHGTRLPKNYTMTLRLPFENDTVGPSRKPTMRRRGRRKQIIRLDTMDSDIESSDTISDDTTNNAIAEASDNEEENSTIQMNNAYTGAVNTIGSIHQRHWFITLDKTNSGFIKKDGEWIRASVHQGFEPFFVRGADVETSVMTGRTSAEVMKDEGVEDFRARKRWWPILE